MSKNHIEREKCLNKTYKRSYCIDSFLRVTPWAPKTTGMTITLRPTSDRFRPPRDPYGHKPPRILNSIPTNGPGPDTLVLQRSRGSDLLTWVFIHSFSSFDYFLLITTVGSSSSVYGRDDVESFWARTRLRQRTRLVQWLCRITGVSRGP